MSGRPLACILWMGTLGLLCSGAAHAQIDTVLLEETASLQFPNLPFKSAFTCAFLPGHPEVVYAANMNAGLGIYDLSLPGTIQTKKDMPITMFGGLDVSTVRESGGRLYLGLGDFQDENNDASGLAVLDPQNPFAPVILGQWDSVVYTEGVSHLLVRNGLAFLSVMGDGIVTLDVSDPADIQFVSRIVPDKTYPAPSSGDHQTRGLDFRNDSLFVAYDRGGLRIIDMSDPATPVEVSKYINLSLNSQAGAAYNDVRLVGTHYAIASVDYCGLDVIDLGTNPVSSSLWWNPWGCGWTNWSGAELHANELRPVHGDSLLFLSAGQSELLVMDITDPPNLYRVGRFGLPSDTMAVYGLDVLDDRVALAYIHTPFHIPPFTPFYSDFGGVKVLEAKALLSGLDPTVPAAGVRTWPNPVQESWMVETNEPMGNVEILDLLGNRLGQTGPIGPGTYTLPAAEWPPGILLARFRDDRGSWSIPIIKL